MRKIVSNSKDNPENALVVEFSKLNTQLKLNVKSALTVRNRDLITLLKCRFDEDRSKYPELCFLFFQLHQYLTENKWEDLGNYARSKLALLS